MNIIIELNKIAKKLGGAGNAETLVDAINDLTRLLGGFPHGTDVASAINYLGDALAKVMPKVEEALEPPVEKQKPDAKTPENEESGKDK